MKNKTKWSIFKPYRVAYPIWHMIKLDHAKSGFAIFLNIKLEKTNQMEVCRE